MSVHALRRSSRTASKVPSPVVDLDAIAAGLAASAADIPLEQQEPKRQYRRVLVTSAYDAWVIRWAPSASLELHDHGGSRGVVHLVEGELVEERTDLAIPAPLETRTMRPGDVIDIAPTTVHGIANLGMTDALSVHVYCPPLSTMTLFELDANRFRADTDR